MDSSAKHPSTSFSVSTHRHPTEEQAMVKAMASIYNKLDAHRKESPNTAVVSIAYKGMQSKQSGYSVNVKVVVQYLVAPE